MTAAAQARAALDAAGQLPDAELDLAGVALQLARIDAPDADWQAAEAHLSALARDAAMLSAERPGADVAVRAGALAGLLAGRWRYEGDRDTYEDPANANLIHVIARRRGLPVTLGILWLHCAQAARWEANGIDFPGHFLIAMPADDGALVLDVFDGGQPLDITRLRTLLRSSQGPKAELHAGMLKPMPARGILLRLQNNLKLRRFEAGDLQGALAAVTDMLRFAPEEAQLWREKALLHEQVGEVSAALGAFQRFLALVPKGDAADRARQALAALRSRLH